MAGIVAITGANGFVGRALSKYLQDKGETVLRLMRQKSEPSTDSFVRFVGDIDASTDWSNVLEGVSVVVHLAARVHVMNDHASAPLDAFRNVNTAGTINLASQAFRAGVQRFIYLSTVKVNGEKTRFGDRINGVGFCETDAPNPSDDYAISKWEAEQALAHISEETGMETVIVRPPLIYGPGVKANFLQLLRLIDKGVPLPLGSIDNRRSLVSLGNLVDFMFECANAPAAAGETFMVADGQDVSTPELIRRMAVFLKRPARLVPVPEALLNLGGNLLGKSAEIERLCNSLQVDIRKAQHVLSWQPPLSLDEGLKQTVAWYQSLKA